MAAPEFSKVAPRYTALFLTLQPKAEWLDELDGVCRQIAAGQARYEAVANKLPNPPWWAIALMHNMECSLSFEKHLHNGDPLRSRTVNVPAGRPAKMPCTWEESAWDALRFDRVDKWSDWSVAGALYKMESFNGYGYHRESINIPSPYLWSGCQHYVKGKYVSDGKYDPNAVSKQLGVAVILHRLCQTRVVAMPGQPVAPAGGAA